MAHKLLKPTISLTERKTALGWHNPDTHNNQVVTQLEVKIK